MNAGRAGRSPPCLFINPPAKVSQEDALVAGSKAQALSTARAIYGRDSERLRVEAALADPGIRVVVVSGPSGIGKTAFLRDIMVRAAKDGAIAGAATHAEADEADIAPLMRALEDAAARGLDQLYEPEAGLATLSTALGPLAPIIAAAAEGPLRRVSGPGQSEPVSGPSASERLYQAVAGLAAWLCGFGQPVVLLLDDWGRAGPRAAEMYARLVSDPRLARLTLLATERDAEPFPLELDPQRVMQAPLPPLTDIAAIALAMDLLNTRDDEMGREALRLVGESRAPFDIVYRLGALRDVAGLRVENGALNYDAAAAAGLAGPAGEIAIGEAIERSPGAEHVLLALAVYAAPVRQPHLMALGDAAQTHVVLDRLRSRGLIADRGEHVALAHDKFREVVRARVSQSAGREMAANIAEMLRARRLSADLTPAERDVMLWRRLEAGLEDLDSEPWAALFCDGAEASRRLGAHEAATAFAEAALSLRPSAPSYRALREGVFAALGRAEDDVARARSERLRDAARSELEQAEARELRVIVARMTDDVEGAIVAAREGLAELGVVVPRRVSWFDVARAALRVVFARLDLSAPPAPLPAAELAVRGPMLRAMNAIAPILFERDLKLAIVFGAGSIEPRVARGVAAGAAIYAFVCSMLGLHRRAGRWAILSDRLQEPSQPLRAVAMQFATGFGHWYVRSRAGMRDRAETILALAYAEGDLGLVAQANRDRVYDALMGETPLRETSAYADRALETARRFDDISNGVILRALKQVAVNLSEDGQEPWRLDGEHLTAAHRAEIDKVNFRDARRSIATLEQTLAIAFGAYGEAAARAVRLKAEFDRARSLTQHRTWTFLSGLALLRVGQKLDPVGMRLLRQAARLNPRDNTHRVLLLDAERARGANQKAKALRLYAAAVDWAEESGCTLEHGLVANAAAEGADELAAAEAAQRFRSAAVRAWRGLGADAVIAHRHGREDTAAVDARRDHAPEPREAELAAARDVAERANAAKSRFIAAVGHELITPLQGLRGLVEQGRKAPIDLDAVDQAVTQLTTLVRDVTDLGAMDGGALTLNPAAFSPNDLLQGLAAQARGQAEGLGRILRFEAAQVPAVIGDATRIQQIVANLIQNALKHGAGAISLSLAADSTERNGVDLRICVADQGEGVDASDVARLFEPFRRGESGGAGYGLGLSIARRLAIAMGGDLKAEIAPGAGTKFWLNLSLPRAPHLGAAPAKAREILLAEDDAMTRRVLGAALRAEGCRVTEAQDGVEALARARQRATPFDLALLDVGMPRMDGSEAARVLAAEEKALRIVLMSAAPIAEDGAPGLSARLRKPISRGDLLRLIDPARVEEDCTDPLAGGAVSVAREIRHALEDIREADGAGDPAEVSRLAHRLAGLAAQSGYAALSAAALALEAAADRNAGHGAERAALQDAAAFVTETSAPFTTCS